MVGDLVETGHNRTVRLQNVGTQDQRLAAEVKVNDIKGTHHITTIAFLALLLPLLALANILWGSLAIPPAAVWDILCGADVVEQPSWHFIVWESRVPQMLTALFCGAALSTAGLLLQTAFRNPLAGPSILGIDAGANLGVAVVMLFLGGSVGVGGITLGGHLLIILAAMLGAGGIMMVLLLLSSLLRSPVMLLITGVIISYLTGAAISLLNFSATESGVHSYIMWGMGNFSGVALDRLPLFIGLCTAGLTVSLLLIKPLDTLLLGEHYAANLGTRIRLTRNALLLCTGLLTATTTAFCGPISFLGLAVPHIARMAMRTAGHRTLLPATMGMGACLALLCNLASTLPSGGSLIPINVITPLIGAPVILYVILHTRKS